MPHKLHRVSAIVIALYVMIHLANHLIALHGIQSHIAFMNDFRRVYRIPAVEILLVICFVYQLGSGIYFIARRWGNRRGLFERLQAISGVYMAFFILVHVSSVLYGRLVLDQDTNFFFAAAGLHVTSTKTFFIPYYTLAVTAFFVHIACAFHYLGQTYITQKTRNRVGYIVIAGGAILAVIIVATFGGSFYHIEIPQEYQARYR